MSLSALIKKGWLRDIATMTPATSATEVRKVSQSVAAAATVAVAQVQSNAANDPAKEPTPASAPPNAEFGDGADRQCWPHTLAMNTAEIDTLKARINLFKRYHLDYAESEALADGLVIRDREQDDRCLCLECSHLRNQGASWSCANWQRLGVTGSAIPVELVNQMQRCRGFRNAIGRKEVQRESTA